MTSETDHPRQRTVAELLAEHGEGAVTGRRRRRRVAEGDDIAADAEAPPAPEAAPAAPAAPEPEPEPESPAAEEPAALPVRAGVRPLFARPADGPQARPERPGRPSEQVPFGQAAESGVSLWDPVVPEGADGSRRPSRPVVDPGRPMAFVPRGGRDRQADQPAQGQEPSLFGSPGNGSQRDRPGDPPTDEFPRITDAAPAGRNGAFERFRRESPPSREADDTDDSGDLREAGFEDEPAAPSIWRRARGGDRPVADGGPPTEAAAPLDLDGGRNDSRGDDRVDDVDDERMSPAGLDGPVDLEPRRRLGRGAGEATGQAWAMVVAQWIVGALVGAALWVGFRFLWRSLPVVALAAAVLITVGLVVIVRALLRNDGMRTTLFAVLVGLLLTVSPAILVLLSR